MHQVVGRALVLGMRIEGERIARARPFERARIGCAGGQREAKKRRCQL